MLFRSRWRRAVLAAAATAALLVFAVLALAAEGSFSRTLTVTGPVDLEVTTGAGNITVRVGEPGRVELKGTIKTRNRWRLFGGDTEEMVRWLESNPPIEQDGNAVRIGYIDDREIRRSVAVSYELVVPRETKLKAGTGSGEQTIDGVRGPVNASTGSGRVTLSNIGDEARATTGSGDVKLESINGPVHASTGSGSIRATRIAGAFSASTGSGDVRLEQSAPGEVKVATGSGRVEVRGVRGSVKVGTGSGDITAQGEQTGEWKLDTSSGDIVVQLPSNAAFDVHARTSSGSIYTDHPLTVRGKVSRRELRGQVRGGGFKLALNTSSGDIRIE